MSTARKITTEYTEEPKTVGKNEQKLTFRQSKTAEALEKAVEVIQKLKERGIVIEPTQ